MTGAKAWRQKGTGRARVGALSVPHRRGGGVAFGPKPRKHTFKVNRKARRRALRAALSVHADRDSVAVLDAEKLSEPSTKTAAGLLEAATKASDITAGVGWGPTLVALAVAFVVAYASIAWLLRYVARNDFGIFIVYRIAVGVAVLGLVATGVTGAT